MPLLERERALLNPLKKIFEEISFDAIFSSDLRRCRQTVRWLFPGKSYCVEKRLREMHFGLFEGKTYEELKDNPLYIRWINSLSRLTLPEREEGTEGILPSGDEPTQKRDNLWSLVEDVSPPGGESIKCFFARIDACLNEAILSGYKGMKVDTHIALVAHGGVLRRILSCYPATGHKLSFWDWKISHGYGYKLSLILREGDWQCRSCLEVPSQEKENM
jgi:alpha-ribazole phosphatase